MHNDLGNSEITWEYIDLNTIVLALYFVGMNQLGKYETGEPIGPSAYPFIIMFDYPVKQVTDILVDATVKVFREREEYVLANY